jgi:hypothetical protein
MRVQIDNTTNLERDTNSMGIVNTDRSARERYLKTKEKIISEREELDNLKKRLAKLEHIVSMLNTRF